MLKLLIGNAKTKIVGEVSEVWTERKAFSDKLRVLISYTIPNVDFSPAYKENKWDGKITLWDWQTKTFPTGCIKRVAYFLKDENIPFKIIDKRKKPEPNIDLQTTFAEHGRELYWYQQKAVDEAVEVGRGIISIATGGGKTMTACEILARLSVAPFLFYVPSRSLLVQTHKEFSTYFKQNGAEPHIGTIGDGVYDINMNGVNVITYQTALMAFNEKYNPTKDKIEEDEHAGEKNRKTIEELQKEEKIANDNYAEAIRLAEEKYADLKKDPSAKPKDFSRAVTKEVKSFKEKVTKAQNASKNRVLSNQNKAKVRNLVENAKGFVVDEAHTAAVIIEMLAYHAQNAYYRIGCSVAANSIIELRGGCFGNGFIGTIEDAYKLLEKLFSNNYIYFDGYDNIRTTGLGIESRGWENNQFFWKEVKTFIRHSADKPMKEIKANGSSITLTEDHSIFKVDYSDKFKIIKGGKKFFCSEPIKCKPSELLQGDILLKDTGDNWIDDKTNMQEYIDVIDILHKQKIKKTYVAVSLDEVTRIQLGMTHKMWYQRRTRGIYGHYLPLNMYVKYKNILPEPTKVYTERSNGTWISPKLPIKDIAYLMGFYLGDGWITGNRICFAVENKLISHICKYIDSRNGIKVNWTIELEKYKDKGSKEIKCSNFLLKNIIDFYIGAKTKCYDKFIPAEWIISWNIECRELLLKGLIDSDGCKQNSEYVYTTTSYDLAKCVISLLKSLGFSSGIYIRKPTLGGIVDGRQITGKHCSYKVYWNTNQDTRTRYIHDDMNFKESPIREINNIEYKEKFVYDLEMNGHHSFVCEQILSANSATPFREDNQEIRMEAAMGTKLIEITCGDLIELGFLVPPNVIMVKCDHLEKYTDYKDVYQKHIIDCWERNYRIKQFAEAFKAINRPVLILVEKLDHGYALESMIKDSVFVPGKDNGEYDPDDEEKDYRRRMLNETEKNNIILIATQWAYVGIDAPAISTLILAGSSQSTVSLYQMIGRVLRRSPETGKTEAVIIDFMDLQTNLHGHSLSRKKVYKMEDNWKFRLIK